MDGWVIPQELGGEDCPVGARVVGSVWNRSSLVVVKKDSRTRLLGGKSWSCRLLDAHLEQLLSSLCVVSSSVKWGQLPTACLLTLLWGSMSEALCGPGGTRACRASTCHCYLLVGSCQGARCLPGLNRFVNWRCLLLERKAMTNLGSILKSRDMTLPTKVHLVKAMVFPVVMYGCESWTIKKAEH